MMIGQTKCPYCSFHVDEAALICSHCRGNLAIGSTQAIRQALLINPSLVNGSPESSSELERLVASIDQSIKSAEAEARAQVIIEEETRTTQVEAADTSLIDAKVQKKANKKFTLLFRKPISKDWALFAWGSLFVFISYRAFYDHEVPKDEWILFNLLDALVSYMLVLVYLVPRRLLHAKRQRRAEANAQGESTYNRSTDAH